MSEYDLLQTGARIRRLIASSVAALVTGGVLAPVLWKVIDPPSGLTTGPWKAFFFFLALACAVAFTATSALLKRREDRAWNVPAKAVAREKSEPSE
jgi:hypothetical protein